MKDKFLKKDQELPEDLFHIAREKGTEEPFSGKYWNTHEEGIYRCAVCKNVLFSSDAKFDSGTGWPSFTDPVNREYVELKEDTSLGMSRTEVLCKTCGAHLGHVFDDLPVNDLHRQVRAGGHKETGGKRYCINSVCLEFKKGIE